MTNFIIQFMPFTQAGEDSRRPSVFAKCLGRVQECSRREVEFLEAYNKYIWASRKFIYQTDACQCRQHKVSAGDAGAHPPYHQILQE
jgi:hypothetical protein